jgi:hypothetical protein
MKSQVVFVCFVTLITGCFAADVDYDSPVIPLEVDACPGPLHTVSLRADLPVAISSVCAEARGGRVLAWWVMRGEEMIWEGDARCAPMAFTLDSGPTYRIDAWAEAGASVRYFLGIEGRGESILN